MNTPNPTPKRVIFLDRDGTINIDHGYVHRVSDWDFAPLAPEALKNLSDAGYTLVVVSNQAGVGDGRFTEQEVNTLHQHMEKLLGQTGVTLDAIVYCPHHRDSGCNCRKPNPGLLQEIENAIGPIDCSQSWMIGDKESDIEFGKNINAKTALIRCDYWTPETLDVKPDLVCDSLHQFADTITQKTTRFNRSNWHNEKILTPAEAEQVADELRSKGKRLVTTNGSFDLLHAGHLDQLEEARKQGDILFVGVNTDAAVIAAKGPGRPLIPEEARAAMLAALTCVDYVVLMPGSYAEEPMLSLLESVKPHTQVNGPDYGNPTTWTEWETMQKHHTKGHSIKKINDFSTSNIVKKIRESR
ncbi:MAG: D-glycero-beta-D-manno-heptose 1,7-bisphosphate 7-phosphatase [Verrucomicrobiia bacterium]